MPTSPRRRYLRGCAAALGLALAGCLDRNTDPKTTPTNTEPPTTTRPTAAETTEETPEPEPPVVWKRSMDGEITAGPEGASESVYVGTGSGTVASFRAADGGEQWSYDADARIQAWPVRVGDTVFVVAGEDELFANHVVVALNADTGAERWTFAPEEWWLEVLGAAGNLLYVATADDAIESDGQTLYALSLDDGTVRWSGEIGDPSAGLVTDEAVYVPTYGRLYAYDAATGEQWWTRALRGYSYRTVAATDGTVCYVASEGDTRGELFALDAATGETKWSHDEWFATSTTLHEGTLYVGGEHVAAFDPASGDRRWQADESGFVSRVPVRDGTLYAGGDAVRAYDTEDGTLGWTWTPEEAVEGLQTAAVGADSIYVDSWSDADPRNQYKFALSLAGKKQWAFKDETDLTDLSSDGERAYVGGENGDVYALK